MKGIPFDEVFYFFFCFDHLYIIYRDYSFQLTFKQLIFFQRPGLQTQIGIFGLNGTGLGFKKENLFWPAWDTDLTIVVIEQVFDSNFGISGLWT